MGEAEAGGSGWGGGGTSICQFVDFSIYWLGRHVLRLGRQFQQCY